MKLCCDLESCHKELSRNKAGTYNVYVSRISGGKDKHFCSSFCTLQWEANKRKPITVNSENILAKVEHLF